MAKNTFPYSLIPETLKPALIKDFIEVDEPKNVELYFLHSLESKELEIGDDGKIIGFKKEVDEYEEESESLSVEIDENVALSDFDIKKIEKHEKLQETTKKNYDKKDKTNKNNNIAHIERLNICDDMKNVDKSQVEHVKQSDTNQMPKNMQNNTNIKHAVKVPYNFIPDYTPVCEFPYKLDIFQLQSFYFLHNAHSIFVSAHTASGKTTILHYCIYLAKLNKTRVIYTSPIKALSNQKFKELQDYNPGIITGDITINKESDVLIVTTEILRNLLYSKNPILTNLEFVIFDEVHYVSDRERGVVWEECIIFMPGYVTIAMLSACIENDAEFASWVGRLRNSTVYVVRTDKRPVPLEYHIVEDESIKSLKNYDGTTNKENTLQQKVNNDNTVKHQTKNIKTHTKNIAQTYKKDNLLYLSKFVIKNFLFPSIFFCFSKKKCHEYANKLYKMYLTEHEKKEVQKVITSKILLLPHDIKKLPQVIETIKYLSNGIAIHHSGLLPFLKELTEIIFSMNLIKIIIATETFAVGVNFPAKSVVFLGLRKRDDFGTRMLTPGEFMQMSGRAGRRGKDKKGVVLINKENYNEFDIKTLIAGKSFIRSRFFLSFSMILRMLRINIKIEDVLKASFSENLVQKDLYKIMTKIEKLKKGIKTSDGKNRSDGKNGNKGEDESDKNKEYKKDNGHKISNNENLVKNNKTNKKELDIDKIERNQDIYKDKKSNKTEEDTIDDVEDCKICNDIDDYIVSLQYFYMINNVLIQKYLEDVNNITNENLFDLTFVLRDYTEIKPLTIKDKSFTCNKTKSNFSLYSDKFYNKETHKLLQKCVYYNTIEYNEINLDTKRITKDKTIQNNTFVNTTTKDTINLDTKRITKNKTIQSNAFVNTTTKNEKMIETHTFDDILYIKKDDKPFFGYNIQHFTLKVSQIEIKSTYNKLQNYTCINCPYLDKHYNQVLRDKLLMDKINELKRDISDENLQLFEDYNKKIDFLIKNNYIDTNYNITIKGRLACEIKTVDEIFITEMIINNMFNKLKCSAIMKLISGFVNFEVCDENDEEILEIINTVLEKLKNKKSTIQMTNDIQTDYNKADLANKYNNKSISYVYSYRFDDQKANIDSYEFKYGNAYNKAIYDWCEGKSIHEIIKSHKVSEGTLVRVVLRLEEFCKEMLIACDIINDIETKNKIEICLQKLKRELTMCVSLYFD